MCICRTGYKLTGISKCSSGWKCAGPVVTEANLLGPLPGMPGVEGRAKKPDICRPWRSVRKGWFPGPVSLFQEGEGVGRGTVQCRGWRWESTSEGDHTDPRLTLQYGRLGLKLACGVDDLEESEGGGDEPERMWSAGVCEFQDLGPDFKQGRTGFCVHAGNTTVAALWRMGGQGRPWKEGNQG